MQAKKIWIGRWTLGVAALHTVFGVLVGGKVLADIGTRGVFNTVGEDPMTGAIVWFLLCGAVLALLGMTITVIERSGQLSQARPLGVGILLLVTIGVVLMPASGFWLMLPAGYALVRAGSARSNLQPAPQ